MPTLFPIDVSIARLVEFHGLAEALCLQELGRLPTHTTGDPVAELICLFAMQGQTGDQIQAWLHDQPEAVAYRSVPPLPPLPSRDRVCGVRTHFQGVTYHLSTGEYPGVLAWADDLSDVDRKAIYARHLALGDTHFVVNLSARYYPTDPHVHIAGTNWDYTQNLPLFKARLRELIVAGLTPVCSLAFDGQDYNPDGGTYGWQWGMDHVAEILAALQADEDLTPYILFFAGFELVTPPGGNWTPDQLFQMYTRLRSLLPHGHLACQLGGYAWPGEGGAVHGSAVDVMSSAPMLAIDVMLAEWGNPGDPERQDGMEQIAARWLGPEAQHIQPKNAGPWYLAVPTDRGPRFAIAFERCLYVWVRQAISHAEVEADAEAFRALGFRYVS